MLMKKSTLIVTREKRQTRECTPALWCNRASFRHEGEHYKRGEDGRGEELYRYPLASLFKLANVYVLFFCQVFFLSLTLPKG